MTTATRTRKTAARKPATRKPKRTAPPELSDWQAMIELAITVPGNLGNTYSRFYPYSFGNMMLLALQGVSTPVATFNRWKELGYTVNKGSKAYFINRPIMFSREDSDGETRSVLGGFKLVPCLFQASQVTPTADAKPIPEAPHTSGDWDLARALSKLDIREVSYVSLDGNMQGYSNPSERTFAISPVATDPMKTILHEVGHIVCGHATPDDPGTSRPVKEFQAEAVALLVGKELSLNLPESRMRAYIQAWLNDHTPTEAEVRTVFDAVTKILAAGRPAPSDNA